MADSDAPASSGPTKTWVIVGASRGIGHEFVEQLLARGDRVVATVRGNMSTFWPKQKDQCTVLNCDVAVDKVVNVRATLSVLESTASNNAFHSHS
jgi:NAD(P)-dependent dehydrogenase (short-subunit alcohol dehydrogenase family)